LTTQNKKTNLKIEGAIADILAVALFLFFYILKPADLRPVKRIKIQVIRFWVESSLTPDRKSECLGFLASDNRE